MKCQIATASSAHGAELKRIAQQCAVDLGRALDCEVSLAAEQSAEPSLTLHMGADEAVAGDAGYCLACRLACFCPKARVSILISAVDAFPRGENDAREALGGGPLP